MVLGVTSISSATICNTILEKLGSGVRKCSSGKARGVYEIELFIDGNILLLTIFTGRESYSPWAEIGVLNSSQNIFDVLERIISLVAEILGTYSRIMVTYTWDQETTSLLDRGVHPAATRIGAILVSRGYYVVRNMYFPEGYTEGSPKLVGERYVNNKWYTNELCSEVEELRKLVSGGCVERGSPCAYAEVSLRNILENGTWVIDKC
jgi:hypothetical protein